jgi:putative SOS response-associated peptidase YedK
MNLRKISGPFDRAEHVTANSMAVRAELQRRLGLVADGFPMWAAGMETTPRRRVDRAWHVALEHGALFLTAGVGDRNR